MENTPMGVTSERSPDTLIPDSVSVNFTGSNSGLNPASASRSGSLVAAQADIRNRIIITTDTIGTKRRARGARQAARMPYIIAHGCRPRGGTAGMPPRKYRPRPDAAHYV